MQWKPFRRGLPVGIARFWKAAWGANKSEKSKLLILPSRNFVARLFDRTPAWTPEPAREVRAAEDRRKAKATAPGVILSVVVPVYNEEEVIASFHHRAIQTLEQQGLSFEILYVNDGSRDATLEILKAVRNRDPRVTIVDLSRNFGKEIAMTAGLDHARGEAVVVIDADLQDPPELIPALVEEWKKGFEVVYAKRVSRDGESRLKKATAYLFYRTLQRMVRGVWIPEDTGDFRLLSRRAVDALRTLRERHRFMKGLFAWIGYSQTAVAYQRAPRLAGKTKWNYVNLWNLALEGITSFSTVPLKAATYVGATTAFFAFLYGIYLLLASIMFGGEVTGFATLMTVITFIGGIQLMAIGIMGEYVARMFDETKSRPLYLVNEYLPSRMDAQPERGTSDSRKGV